jgi:glycosidase
MPWDATPGGGFTTGTPWHAFAPGHERANVAAEAADPGSLLSHYRQLIRVRHVAPALARGSLELLTERGPVLAFVRATAGERVLVAVNLGGALERVSLAAFARRTEALYATAGVSVEPAGATVRVTLPAHATAVFRIR